MTDKRAQLENIQRVPISPVQQRSWFLDKLQLDSSAQYSVRLAGPLDIEALRLSLQEIIRRHESLRSSFPTVNDMPVQEIRQSIDWQLSQVDLSNLEAEKRDREVQRLLETEAKRAFDVARGPLLRAMVIRLGDDDHIWQLSIHRIAADRASLETLQREILILYTAFSAGLANPLTEKARQYRDFWQRQEEYLQGESLRELQRYWKTSIPVAPSPFQLPYEKSPLRPSWDASRANRRLSAALGQRLEALGADANCCVEKVVLAAFKVLLHRLTLRDRIFIGMLISNRDLSFSEGVVGPLANILVFGTTFSADMTFTEILEQLVSSMESTLRHRAFPFEKLVQELQPEVAPDVQPLVNIAFDPMASPALLGTALPGTTLSKIETTSEKTAFSLKLSLRKDQESLSAELTYQNARYDKEWIEVLLDQFMLLLQQIAEQPDRAISSYSLVTEACRQFLPLPDVPLLEQRHETVPWHILKIARNEPARSAICHNGKVFTYKDLADAATELASDLISIGLIQGDVVAILGQMNFGTVVSMTAVLLSGGVIMTLDPVHPPERNKTLLEIAIASWMICLDENEGIVPSGTRVKQLSVCPNTGRADISGLPGSYSCANPKRDTSLEFPDIDPSDPAYVAFTSGTTGVPKGVFGCHKGLSHTIRWQSEEFSIGADDRCAQMSAMTPDGLFRETFLPLTTGASLHLRPGGFEYAADMIFPWLEEQEISVLYVVPAIVEMWLSSIPEGVTLPNLRWLFLGGEPLRESLVSRWRSAFPSSGNIVNFYGTTETNLVKLFYQVPPSPSPGMQPIGFSVPGSQALVLSESGALCGRGEPGEVVIRSPFLSQGYCNAPKETAHRFGINPFREDASDLVYRTGDQGRYGLNGCLQVSSRLDRQIKIRGIRVEPEEVSALLAGHPGVATCAVGTRLQPRGTLALYAYVVTLPEYWTSPRDLLSYLGKRLPQAMIPTRVVILDELPLTKTGKVDYGALRSLEIGEAAEQGAQASSATLMMVTSQEVIEVLLGLWAEVFGRSRVGIDDSFFESGGDSLLATRLVSRLNLIFNLEIPLRAFFEAPTIARLAEVIHRQFRGRDNYGTMLLEKMPRDGIIPLSFAQQRLWFMHKLAPLSTAYNLPTAFYLRGPLKVDILEKALRELVKRHEALRTDYPTVDDKPCQRIAENVDLRIPVTDLRSLHPEAKEAETRRLVEQEAARAFDLENGPLLRVVLVRLQETRYVFLINLPHIVSDGWSQGILFKELSLLYRAFSEKQESPLPELQIQYADFAIWQRAWLTGKNLSTQMSYWMNQLRDLVPLDMPTDHPRPSVQSFHGAGYEVVLHPDLSSALENLSLRTQTSLFMTLLAGFQVLLHRWTGQTEIVVGAPIANRNREEIEGLIGFFVNNLVLRGDLRGDPSFLELLDRDRELALGAYMHQDLPFDRIVEQLSPQRDFSRHPFFQVVLALHNVPQFDLLFPGIEIRPYELALEPVRLDLEFHFTKTEGGLRLRVVWDTDLFDAKTISHLVQHLESILSEAVKNPRARISELSLLSTEERKRLLKMSANPVPFPDSTNIHSLFEQQAEASPEAIALEFEGRILTYSELNQRANQLAFSLQEHGVGLQSKVAICVTASIEMLVSVLAVLKAGAAFVPMDPAYPRHRLSFMLEDSRIQLFLTQRGLQSAIPAENVTVVYFDETPSPWAHHSRENPSVDVKATDLAYVIYTSGSTGAPKGVQIEHRGVCNLAMAQVEAFGVTASDRLLQFASLSFDASVSEIFMALTSGATLVLASRSDMLPGPPLLSFLRDNRISNVTLSPSILAATGFAPLPELGTLIVAGEACSAEIITTWAPGRRFFNAYGPTEVTVCATLQRCTAKHPTPLIGGPMANQEVFILQPDLSLAPIGVPGEIHVGGAGLARGYLNRPELTRERFINHPLEHRKGERLYKTGDLGRFRPNASIEFLGRIDKQTKIRGFRIEPGEIEYVINQHPSVTQALVEVRDDLPGGQGLVAYVVPQLEWSEAREQRNLWAEEQIEHWQSLYQELHGRDTPEMERDFNISGWNSSFTGEAIPAEEMAEWVDTTVDRILALGPRRVLEIGCGTGLILLSVAPESETCIGTDFSSEVLDSLKARINKTQGLLQDISLRCQRADDFSGLGSGAFDTIVLNSVVQYFPDAAYFLRVIEGAAELACTGGRIFIGDVRCLPLLDTLNASIEAFHASSSVTMGELRRRMHRRSNREGELALFPRFFLKLQSHIPRIKDVAILPKRGTSQNELTRFRYDVILQLDEPIDHGQKPIWRDWQQDGLSLASLRQILQEQQPQALGVSGIVNAHLSHDVRLMSMVSGADENITLADFKKKKCVPGERGVSVEQLYALGQELGYGVTPSWVQSGIEGTIEVLFRRGFHTPEYKDTVLFAPLRHLKTSHEPLMAFANNPLRGKVTHLLEPELREHLKTQLPDFMIPAGFVVLDRIPLTPNGKIDHRALPAAAHAASESTYVAPRNDNEEKLAAIWGEILGLDRVGVHDNFFDLGGDSILSIQVVSRATRAGLPLTARAVFEFATIAELVEAMPEHAEAAAIEEAVAGPVTLTPIQRWFFELGLKKPEHFNFSLMLRVAHPLDQAALVAALAALPGHHSALRLRFYPSDGKWRQELVEESEVTVPLEVVDLSKLSQNQQKQAISISLESIQGGMNLGRGPLFRAAYFKLGSDHRDRLFLTAHHLVMDGVSWGIILEDLRRAYQARFRGGEVSLGAKTTPFSQWAETLERHVASHAVSDELTYWSDGATQPIPELFTDFDRGPHTVASEKTVSEALSIEHTQSLLALAGESGRSQIEAVLLCAMLRAFHRRTGENKLWFDLESHGRSELLPVDLSRTVGWFTAMYPVLLRMSPDDDCEQTLESVITQLQGVPNRGIGFGLLRYLSADEELVSQLSDLPPRSLYFNYQGRMDRFLQAGELFTLASDDTGPTQNMENRRTHRLAVNSAIVAQSLRFDWSYSENTYREETVRDLAAAVSLELQDIIRRRSVSEIITRSASSLPEAAAQQSRWTSSGHLVTINSGGPLPPLFLIHPVGGFVFCYAPMARAFGAEQPMYAIRAWDGSPEEPVYADVTTMAASYVRTMRSVQTTGPYQLGGWSMGGVIAFEMARQLELAGEEISFLFLLDAAVPKSDVLPEHAHRLHKPESVSPISRDGVDAPVARASDADLEGGTQNTEPSPQEKFADQFFSQHVRAMVEHHPGSYNGRVYLFKAQERPPGENEDRWLGWKSFSRAEIEVFSIPGDHLTIVREPNVRTVVRHLKRHLAKV